MSVRFITTKSSLPYWLVLKSRVNPWHFFSRDMPEMKVMPHFSWSFYIHVILHIKINFCFEDTPWKIWTHFDISCKNIWRYLSEFKSLFLKTCWNRSNPKSAWYKIYTCDLKLKMNRVFCYNTTKFFIRFESHALSYCNECKLVWQIAYPLFKKLFQSETAFHFSYSSDIPEPFAKSFILL